ncbi:PREDICTED: venom carboxylesterase-6-like [Dinoponera quadriceps]|uniref:Carboxylic ester hydrolase n=1 Tax=Dinoponera quadriceps TaxID=609295 RepID=A0A6P3XHP2_DINQU|nr:PREDICTED: venom carboxylesterase-6-like [Dinoponera quadriceps]
MLIKLPTALLCFGLAVCVNSDETAPRIKIPLGGLKGYYKTSQNGRRYEAYEGIPYALPPVGELRFKPPQRTTPWVGELPATKFSSPCIQRTQIPYDPMERVEGAEDCLYLNIYVPVREKSQNKTPLPVLFWIHGGAFQFGAGMMTGAKYLMDHDVILVTINYRLGPLGFLSTEDDVVPGNMGLKDQSMALRWVSENIESFGGDSKRITLSGMSAGGASVHYHYLSRMSAGLFQGGISISGTAFLCWTQTENASEKAKKMGALMGCSTTNTRDMIDCLRQRPAHVIVEDASEFMTFFYNPFTPFGPVPEKFGDSPFIDRKPVEIVNSGDVQDIPWITSVVSEEGLYPVAEFIYDDSYLKQLNDNWDVIGPEFLDFNYTIPREKHVETVRRVKKHYFGAKSIDRANTEALIKMAGDRFFVVDSEKAARMQARVNQNPVWYYYYSYKSMHSLSDILAGKKIDDYGVSHGDDVFLILDTAWIDPTIKKEDNDMQRILIDIWVSFATNGIPKVPGVKWPRLDPTKKELNYLHIESPTKINMDSCANLGEKEFWNSINFNENKLRHTPPNKEEF